MGSTRVVWCRENGSGARTGNSQKAQRPGFLFQSLELGSFQAASSPPASTSASSLTVGLGHPRQVPREKPGGRLYGRSAPQAREGWNGLPAQTSPLQEKDRGMENFFLFVLSSSFCTLVASITLLLRPLVGLP